LYIQKIYHYSINFLAVEKHWSKSSETRTLWYLILKQTGWHFMPFWKIWK